MQQKLKLQSSGDHLYREEYSKTETEAVPKPALKPYKVLYM